jgi:low temperature requirement protein LtrA
VTESAATESASRKRVSWVELYFDLIFVFAVSQIAHAIAEDPRWRGVFAALGVFITLWWTWIGFVVLYNRQGDDRLISHRVVVLLGTIPCAVAATQVHFVFDEGKVLGYCLALATARFLLAGVYLWSSSATTDEERTAERRARGRLVPGYAFCGLLFAGSAAIPPPWRYYPWALAVALEGSLLLLGERRVTRQRIREQRQRSRLERIRAQFAAPTQPGAAVDSGHLAERFGLFVIILLGEIVVTVGVAAIDRPHQDLAYWLSLIGGLVLGGALWWIYFDAAADINEKLLSASGGNPTLAYSLYAVGHLVPAFSLLVIAAGVSLSLHEEPPSAASWLITGGLTAYLVGTRSFSTRSESRTVRIGTLAVLVLTACLALLGRFVSAPVVVAIAAGWAVLAAVVVTVLRRRVVARLGDDPLAFLT